MLPGMDIDEGSRDAVASRLKPHLTTLEKCFRTAWFRWAAWLKALDGSPADLSTRSRASVIYDFIVAEAIKAFLGKEGIRVRKERGLLVLRFQDRVALRFKKFSGRTLRVSANKTKQTELFSSQMLEYSSGAPLPLTHVVAGYLLDGLALDMSRLAITCTLNGKHLWAPIDIVSDEPGRSVVPLPASPVGPPVPTVRSTRKPQKKDESGSP